MKYSETTELIQSKDLKNNYQIFMFYNVTAYIIAILGFLLITKVQAIEDYKVPTYIITIGMSVFIFLSGYLNFKQALKETHKTVIRGEVSKLGCTNNYYYLYLIGTKIEIGISAKMYHNFAQGDKIALHIGVNNKILRYEKL